MLRFASILILLSALSPLTNAQEQQFPYKARVTDPEVYVRSGAGEKFYPTLALARDATVTVRRHDPGGWFMIDPPKGSFSWIPAKYVQQTSADTGQLLESNVVVSVGSAFGDETHVWQRSLMAGEKIHIIEEKTVETLSGPQQMFRIAPPSREYRWIPGSAVLPVGKAAQAIRDKDPYAIPSHIVQQQSQQQATANTATDAAKPPVRRVAPSDRLAKVTRIRAEQKQLHALDQQFRNMIFSDPSQWDLERIEQAYLELQQKATHKPVAGQIDLRYPAIRKYRQRKAEFDDLNRLTSETERRDAELLARQFGFPTNNPDPTQQITMAPGQTTPFAFGPPVQPPLPPQVNGSMLIPNIDAAFTTSTPGNRVAVDTNLPVPTEQQLPSTTAAPAGNGYIGAGYVQRGTAEEGSGYILLSSAGKVLAHLHPEGSVDLEAHLGRAVGLKGRRYFDKSLENDRIDVTGLENVTIR